MDTSATRGNVSEGPSRKQKRVFARDQLLKQFEIKQALTCSFLSFPEIAKHWAPRRPEPTLKAAKDAALADLMEAAYDGHFPSMLLLTPEAGVEYVPEVGGDLDRETHDGPLFDPSLADEATAYLDPTKLNKMRGMGLRDLIERDLLHSVAPNIWITCELAISFFRKRGVDTNLLPNGWVRAAILRENGQLADPSKSANAQDELATYSKWLSVQKAPWEPPAILEAALRKIEGEPVIWLNRAVDVMAFGDDPPATDLLELAARRCQASRALCEAARNDHVHMIGCPDEPGDASDSIPRSYFDIPRQLRASANSLGVFSDPISDDEFFPIDTGRGYQKWFNVRIETSSLMVWLWSVVRTDAPQGAPDHYMMTRPGKGTGRKSNLVFDAIAEQWPSHRIPMSLSPKEIEKEIEDGLKRRGIKTSAYDDIRRILGLK
jgi:hypothetical protein